MAQEGADIVVSDINLEAAEIRANKLKEIGRRVITVRSDITVEKDCQSLIRECLKTFGKIDILVNNAGHFGKRLGLPFTNQTEEEWDDNYNINVKGPFFLCKAVSSHMMERSFGKIINILNSESLHLLMNFFDFLKFYSPRPRPLKINFEFLDKL